MKSWKKILTVPFLAATLLLLQAVPAMAAVTEADVQAVGKETVAGNVLIWWFLSRRSQFPAYEQRFLYVRWAGRCSKPSVHK